MEEKDRDRGMGFSVVCLHGRWGEKQKKKEWGEGGEARRHQELERWETKYLWRYYGNDTSKFNFQ